MTPEEPVERAAGAALTPGLPQPAAAARPLVSRRPSRNRNTDRPTKSNVAPRDAPDGSDRNLQQHRRDPFRANQLRKNRRLYRTRLCLRPKRESGPRLALSRAQQRERRERTGLAFTFSFQV